MDKYRRYKQIIFRNKLEKKLGRQGRFQAYLLRFPQIKFLFRNQHPIFTERRYLSLLQTYLPQQVSLIKSLVLQKYIGIIMLILVSWLINNTSPSAPLVFFHTISTFPYPKQSLYFLVPHTIISYTFFSTPWESTGGGQNNMSGTLEIFKQNFSVKYKFHKIHQSYKNHAMKKTYIFRT